MIICVSVEIRNKYVLNISFELDIESEVQVLTYEDCRKAIVLF
jgi:hypothetical protein